MDNTFLIFGAVALALILIPRIISSFRTISPQKAKELVSNNNAMIVDVRQPGEFRSNHIKNAINIPLNNIKTISKKASKDKEIIVYCQSGARSSSALKQLKSLG